jgi:predicted alpha/beta superfamily hydrolase
MQGKLTIESINSQILGRKRKIRIWTPPSYNPRGNHPVLYAADAQMKFTERDPELPYGSWGLDEWLERLALPIVVVAVDNSPQRRREYFPLTPEFEKYQSFLTEELIPWSRQTLGVSSDPRRIGHIGSSMGGILGFALALNNPQLFGTALCLSPWFEVEDYRYRREILEPLQHKPSSRFYLDSGIQDWRMLDDGYRGTMEVRSELLRLGCEEGKDFLWLRDLHFPSPEELANSKVKPENRDHATRNQHMEYAWRRRLEQPLRFFSEAHG